MTLTLFDAGYYKSVYDIPYWDYVENANFMYSGISIYCGGRAFVRSDGNWLDITTGFQIFLHDGSNGPSEDICDSTEGLTVLAMTQMRDPRGGRIPLKVAIIIMCDDALRRIRPADVVRSDNNALEASSFTMVHRKGMLTRGQQMKPWKTADGRSHTGLGHVWSVALLHELFHYVLDPQSNHDPFLPLSRDRLADDNGSVSYLSSHQRDLRLATLHTHLGGPCVPKTQPGHAFSLRGKYVAFFLS
jgi:hypothetical protein